MEPVGASAQSGPRVLVTGANGFVGAALVDALRDCFDVRGATRGCVGALGPDTDWSRALEGCGAVVHLAAPAHAKFEEGILRRAIVEGTATLAVSASKAGVVRFIYLSSIHALARCSERALRETDTPAPTDAYGHAKLASEQAVLAQPGLRPVVLRPPLVHGPGARGNWARLLRLADSRLPLPLKGITNRRSLIALGSLCGAIRAALQNDAPTGVFHVADEPFLSTPNIVGLMRKGMGRPPGLFALPGLAAIAPRALTQSLEIDASRFREAFGFIGVDSRQAVEDGARAWKAAQ